MDPWIGGQPSLSLDLNVGLPTAHPVAPAATKVLVEENFLAVRKDREQQVEALEAELRRVGEENRRLSEMLRAVVAKYTELQGQVNDMVAAGNNRQSSTSEGGSAASPSRKRIRSDSLDTAGGGHHRKPSPPFAIPVHDQMECTSAAAAVFHEPGRRIREECKPKVSRRYVHADPADLSLVSDDHHHHQFTNKLLLLPRDHRT
jgi:hypothetical protein